jgi:prepilin-type N-terminal cleavage/methylation domain-containing protein
MRDLSRTRGMTMIEVVIVVALSTLIMSAVYVFMRSIYTNNRVLSASIDAQNEGRRILKPMVSEIREASTASTGVFAIGSAQADSFVFYSDIDDDIQKERIRYFLDGTILKKGITQPAGSPLSYDSQNEVITSVIHNVVYVQSTPIFTYYDRSFDGTTSPLSTPVPLGEVRLVRIALTIDARPHEAPTPITISTFVTIRNLKDN